MALAIQRMSSDLPSKDGNKLPATQEEQQQQQQQPQQPQGQSYQEAESESTVGKRRLQLKEETDTRRRRAVTKKGSNSNPDTILPRCEPFPLTVGSQVALPGHQNHHPYPQIVIAHRGASAHLPEHSLEAYRLALELGADYIEPDLVASKDGYLIAMHSLDLTETTNVLEVFGSSKNKTLSRYKEKQQQQQQQQNTDTTTDENDSYGYWVYDFTLEELKELRLNQRLGGSDEERSTAFDGLFEIPTLTEILELLNDWNENVQHLWYSTNSEGIDVEGRAPQQQRTFPPPPRGLYAELKNFPWILEDANINMLDLLFEHINDEQFVWETALLRHMCDTKHLRWGEYKLPPFILQSFDADVLKEFTIRWKQLAKGDANNNEDEDEDENIETINSNSTIISLFSYEVPIDDGNSTALIPLPTPPTIVLVSRDNCRDEAFWYEMGDSYRNYISGVGPDKMCFFRERPQSAAASATSTEDAPPPLFQYEPTLMEQATKLNWVVHPWTERPEHEFFATTRKQQQHNRRLTSAAVTPFDTALEEILFLKCTVGVHGVFSESVNIAVRALTLPCPKSNKKKNSNANLGINTDLCPSNNKSTSFSLDTTDDNNSRNKGGHPVNWGDVSGIPTRHCLPRMMIPLMIQMRWC
eukprot:jgi/Psemu1/17371/gm1.17371_g